MYLMELVESKICKKNEIWNVPKDMELTSEKADIYIWFERVLNCDYFPIIQVDDAEGNMILHREGPENRDHWIEWIRETLNEYTGDDSWDLLTRM